MAFSRKHVLGITASLIVASGALSISPAQADAASAPTKATQVSIPVKAHAAWNITGIVKKIVHGTAKFLVKAGSTVLGVYSYYQTLDAMNKWTRKHCGRNLGTWGMQHWYRVGYQLAGLPTPRLCNRPMKTSEVAKFMLS